MASFAGHTDGVWEYEDERFCVEYKTHNAKSFASLSPGNIPAKHRAQGIVYAGYMKLDRTLCMAVNKDTDDLFIDWIEFELEEFRALKAKADYITRADKPPERICRNPSDFKAKFCNERNACFGIEMPRVSCMNCTSAHKGHDTVTCDMTGQPIGEPCEHHSFNPYAMNDMQGWKIVQFHPKQRAVEYITKDGEVIINGAAPYGTPSTELCRIDR
jgi:hypothetical protein